MTVIGLDLAITATGIAYADGSTAIIKPTGGDERLIRLSLAIAEAIDPDTRLAVIEDLPKGAMAAGITGMVHGIARLALMEAGRPYVLVVPATLKKFATGNGGAGKPEMAVAAYKRAGVEFADDNQCDAWWLRVAGLFLLDEPPFDLPAAQIAALTSKVSLPRWP